MTLHQQIPTSALVTDRSDIFRLKALFCEERCRESSDQTSKQDRADLAIDWHTMAYLAASTNGAIEQIEVPET
jgi:hypothetical protein